MCIQLNPMAQAELEVDTLMRRMDGRTIGAVGAAEQSPKFLAAEIMNIVRKTVLNEKLMMGAHEQCGADNPEGLAAKCKCACHKGHYRHVWEPMIKTPTLAPDGSYHLIDRCKFCPDMRLKIIKPAFVGEKHTLVSLEYHVRGEHMVLSREEWVEKQPQKVDDKLLRETKL